MFEILSGSAAGAAGHWNLSSGVSGAAEREMLAAAGSVLGGQLPARFVVVAAAAATPLAVC